MLGQFVIAIGQFVRPEIQLEALGYRRVAVADPRERALRCRPVAYDRDAAAREMRLDAMRDQQIQPVVAAQAIAIDDLVGQRRAQFLDRRAEWIYGENLLE